MNNYRDVAEVLQRIVPEGPEPQGWATRARRRSRGRRALAGVAAVAVVSLLAVPTAMSLMEMSRPDQRAIPAEPDSVGPWEPPVQCVTPTAELDPAGVDPADVVAGTYCWSDESGTMSHARQLSGDELVVVTRALGLSQALGSGSTVETLPECSEPFDGQIWLEADGGGVLVQEGRECGLVWRDADGDLLRYSPATEDGDEARRIRAAFDGIFAFSRAMEVPDRSVCWAKREPAHGVLSDAVSGHLCDPTGTTVAGIERELPDAVVALVAESAASQLVPAGSPVLPTGWSLVLSSPEGQVFWLSQLADGTLAYQDEAGDEWVWAPTGETAEALRDVGLDHLP